MQTRNYHNNYDGLSVYKEVKNKQSMGKLIWFYNQETTPNCFLLEFIGTTNYKTACAKSYKNLWII